ncbi:MULTISPECIES: MFS transporter [Peribacillus]|jgi:MFS family permease|uniref:MFS transporter n=1 Tax=Peribacillus TaxID=2675229 RepID=UPI00177EFF69|nr:MFS transporter [Peribacillus frigoritolerans]MBD8137920.1 MFS transporter [Bacillus sp. CFBP 13597]MCK2018811.1 MFS transporter [Peribacillus frigoritolerans]MEB2491909.1 MFS transporter [Peribacillus frigoritolerans]UYY98938.1 MFS transporter [Peribacillus frigoritolerans]WHY14078.1 MFS transporter [Peribacillus frigoritolerans]
MNHKPKLWTKDFLIVSSVNFFLFLTFYVLMVTLTIYTMDNFNASQAQAGLASSIFVLGAVLVRPIAGKKIDKIGRRKMLLGSLVLFLIASIGYFLVNSLSLLLIDRFIQGFAFGLATTATGTIAADIIPNERRGEGTGYFAMSTNLAMAFGPFIGLLITQHFSYSIIFYAASLFAAFSLVASLFMNVPEGDKGGASPQKGFKISDYFEKRALPISIFIGFAGFTYSSILSYLTSFAKEMDLMDAASFFFVVFAVFLLASRPFTGRMFDVKGENAVIYPSLLLFAVGMVILSQSHHGITLLIAGALIGVGYGTFQSSCQAISIKEAPSNRMGLATSTFFTMYDFGIGVGPFLLGFLIPFTGFKGLFIGMSVFAFVLIGIYYLAHGKKASARVKMQHEERLSA